MEAKASDLLTATLEVVQLAAVEALRTGDVSLLERVDQAIPMRFLHLGEHGGDRRKELARLLESIADSRPAREVTLSAVQRKLAEWEHLHTLLHLEEAGEDPIAEARRFLKASTYGEAILLSLRDGPLLKEVLLKRSGVASEASLSQIMAKMEARGLVCREPTGRKVEVALGWLGEMYLRPTQESRHSPPIVPPRRAEHPPTRPNEVFLVKAAR